jgi:hypothetical protein
MRYILPTFPERLLPQSSGQRVLFCFEIGCCTFKCQIKYFSRVKKYECFKSTVYFCVSTLGFLLSWLKQICLYR